jgi:hypothetical protein
VETLSEKPVRNRKRLYVFAALALTVCVGLSVFISIELGAAPFVLLRESNQQTTATVGSTPTSAIKTKENCTSLTHQQAIDMAMPLIEQYAEEHNRTIINVTATLALSADDGDRGGPTFEEVFALDLPPGQKHDQYWYFPAWTVRATFDSRFNNDNWTDESGLTHKDTQYWIVGYTVTIWADTEHIKSANEEGIM